MVWMVIGCIIPDLPWIYVKLLANGVFVNPYDLRLYAMVQASLLFCLLLSGAVALCTHRSRIIFLILALNCLGHLLLDTVQIKWGNGVHLFFPFSNSMQQLNYLWPDHPLTLVATVFGVCYFLYNFKSWSTAALPIDVRPLRKAWRPLILFCLYLFAPLPLLSQLDNADAYFLHTLRRVEDRPGKAIALDRVHYFADRKQLRIYTGEYLSVEGRQPAQSGRVSLHGRFRTPHTIVVSDYHFHQDRRDIASIIGLFMACLLLLQSVRITILQRTKIHRGF
jgi:hypothetical protein